MPYDSKQKQRAWYIKNHERVLFRARERYEKKRAEIIEYNRMRYHRDKEKILIRSKIYRDSHKEERKAAGLLWARSNKEKRRIICRRYREKKLQNDPEYFNRKSKMYRDRDPEKAREHLREYRKARPAWNRLQKYKRRMRCGSGQMDKEHLNKEFDSLVVSKLKEQNYKCLYCGKDIQVDYSIDHIIPLSKGGTNEIENIDLVCKPCNTRKGTRNKEYFMKLILEDNYNEKSNSPEDRSV